jgi:hypothetical protein
MLRGVEDVVAGAALDDAALVHDRDHVAHVPHDGEIVADEEVGDAEVTLQVHEQVEDLALHGDVEGRDGLVADDELWLQGQGPGDADALLLPARERGRPLVPEGRVDAHPRQQLVGAAALLGVVVEAVDGPRLGHDVAGAEAWVKCRGRVLVDELDVPAHAPQLRTTEREEVDATEDRRAGVRLDEPKQEARGRRLARPRAAHQAVRPARLHGQVDVRNGVDDATLRAAARRERLAQPASVEQEVGHRRSVARPTCGDAKGDLASLPRSLWAMSGGHYHRRGRCPAGPARR